jgi:hypothetical protein
MKISLKLVLAIMAVMVGVEGFVGGEFAQAETFVTADRVSYIVTLDRQLDDSSFEECMDRICDLSGDSEVVECEVIFKKARIGAARLSSAAARKVRRLSCVTSLREERFDFEPRPRVGRSN